MHDGKQLLQALDSLWEKYQKRLTDCHQRANEEAVHKLRTGTRRFLALIELLQALAPNASLKKLRKNLKKQLDAFDDLRDTQVMLLEVSASQAFLPELRPFWTHLQRREHDLLLETPANLAEINLEKLESRIIQAKQQLASDLGKHSLKSAILAVIDEVYQVVLSRYQTIDVAHSCTIHRTRIAVKKLRYLLESGESLLPPLPVQHLENLQAYLTRMGEIQDSSVLLLHLKTFYGQELPLSVQTHYQHRHSSLLNAFMLQRTDIELFWRPNAQEAFPWDTGRSISD